MITRRDFIRRIAGVIAGASIFGRPVFRRATLQTTPEPFVFNDDIAIFQETERQIAIAARKSLEKLIYDEYWSRHFKGPTSGIENASMPDEMERILAANPGISREDAFFQAVMEIAEASL
jgi:hypothetical protein